MTATRAVPEVPSWYTERDINYAELSKATGAPIDSLYGWHKTWRAQRRDIGHRLRGSWLFSCRDLVCFSMAAACSRLRFPVSIELLSAIADHIEAERERDKPLLIGAPDNVAAVMIHAPLAYTAAVEMMAVVRAGEDADAE